MRSKTINLTAAALAVALFLGMTVAAFAGSGRTELVAELTPPSGLTSGKAKFEVRSDRMRLSVEGEDLSVFGTATVKIAGAVAGTARIALGAFDFNVDTRDGEAVPNVRIGDSVQVLVGGTVILSGRFALKD